MIMWLAWEPGAAIKQQQPGEGTARLCALNQEQAHQNQAHITGSVPGQVSQGFWQLDLVEGVPAYDDP